MLTRWPVLLLCVLSTQYSVLSAQCASAAEEQPGPSFTAETAGGAPVTGPLQRLEEGWAVRLGTTEVKAGELLALRQAGKPLPPPPLREQLLFVNGDRTPGTLVKVADERLAFRFGPEVGGGKEVELPLAAVAVVWLAAPDGTDRPDLLLRRLAAEERARDKVLLRNGDVVEGILTAADADTFQVEVAKKPVPVARTRVAAVALSTELANSLRPKGAYARLVLAGGARLSLASAACDDGKTLTGTTLFEAPVRVPLEQVHALYLYQGRAEYLSERKPLRYEHTPYLGAAWPFVADGSVGGGDLRLGGSTFDRGLGMHSESRLTWDVSAGFQRFEALVGLDEQAGRHGSVRVRVLLDGKAQDIGWDKELTARAGAVPVRVNVAGARELTLVVDFGRRGDVEDHVDWVDARLVK